MDVELLKNVVVNAAILTVMSVLLIHPHRRIQPRRWLFGCITGVVAGLTGVLLLLQSASYDPTHMLDARNVLIGSVAMFYGAIPTAISLGVLVVTRIIFGGAGVLASVVSLCLSAALGLFWNHHRFGKLAARAKYHILNYYLFGGLSTGATLFCIFLLPKETAWLLFRQAIWVEMIVFPLAYLTVGSLAQLMLQKIRFEEGLLESDNRFQIFFENAPIGIAIVRGMAEFLNVNAMFETIMGRSKEQMRGLDWFSVVHSDDRARMIEGTGAFFSGKINDYRGVFRIFRSDGETIWAYILVAAIDLNAPRDQAQYYLLVEDVTKAHESEIALQAALEKYKDVSAQFEEQFYFLRSLFDATEDWIFSKDKNERYRACNRAFARSVGLPESEIVGRTTDEVSRHMPGGILSKETLMVVNETDRRLLSTGESQHYEETFREDGKPDTVMEIIKTPYYDRKGEFLGIVCTGRDVTERKRRENEILYLSERDGLTGLYNRVYFERMAAEMEAPAYLPVSAVMCDLNGLNLVNDSFGHAKGDELLRRAAEILLGCKRTGDVAARVGGDEFYLLMPHTSEEKVRRIIACMERAYERRAAEPDSILRYSGITMGSATKNTAEEHLSETIRNAEETMYRRKLLSQKGVHGAALNSIRSALHEKSNETQEHADRIGDLTRRIGALLSLSEGDLNLLQLAAELHDIGKISIDQTILTKTAPLDEEEWRKLKQHPEIGYRITQAIPELRAISDIILTHHERWDGTGYPQGLRGEQIPLMARIVTVADAFDAMTEGRPYKLAMTAGEAKDELVRLAGKQFDPEIVKLFVEQIYPSIERGAKKRDE